MKSSRKFLMYLTCSVFLVFGIGPSASAILINPDTDPQWTGTENANLGAEDVAIIVSSGPLNLLYKMDVGASEEGLFASSYTTTYSNEPDDPADADIGYDGGDFITGDDLYLLVKDGNHDPYWYLFDLNNLEGESWNGTETLALSGFWPSKGAISHVSIFGTATPVSEPATMLLLGAGLIGLAGFGRKKTLKKNQS